MRTTPRRDGHFSRLLRVAATVTCAALLSSCSQPPQVPVAVDPARTTTSTDSARSAASSPSSSSTSAAASATTTSSVAVSSSASSSTGDEATDAESDAAEADITVGVCGDEELEIITTLWAQMLANNGFTVANSGYLGKDLSICMDALSEGDISLTVYPLEPIARELYAHYEHHTLPDDATARQATAALKKSLPAGLALGRVFPAGVPASPTSTTSLSVPSTAARQGSVDTQSPAGPYIAVFNGKAVDGRARGGLRALNSHLTEDELTQLFDTARHSQSFEDTARDYLARHPVAATD